MIHIIDYIAFGRRIRCRRKAKQMTQYELAEAATISVSFLGHIERGTRKVSMETLIRIVSALGTTTEDLLKGVVHAQWDIPCTFSEPEDHFAVIRRELDLLEAKYKGTKRTPILR